MQSRVRFLGHPLHQLIVPLPLGLLVSAALFDLLDFSGVKPGLSVVAFWNSIAGVAGALAAILSGLPDWLKIPRHTRAKRIGAVHGICNTLLAALFFASVQLRAGAPGATPALLPMALELLALALGAVGAWLGGELLDRLGIGVDAGAHVNAPSSLRKRRVILPPSP